MGHHLLFLYIENSKHIEACEPEFVPLISWLYGCLNIYIGLIYWQLGCSIDVFAVDDFALCNEFFCHLNEYNVFASNSIETVLDNCWREIACVLRWGQRALELSGTGFWIMEWASELASRVQILINDQGACVCWNEKDWFFNSLKAGRKSACSGRH